MLAVGCPSIFTIQSPGRMPAISLGPAGTMHSTWIVSLKMMKTMRDLDDSGHLWHKWDFDADERLQQQRLAAHMHSIKRTFMA